MKLSINKRYAQISLYVIITVTIILCLALAAKNITLVAEIMTAKIAGFLDILTPVIIGFIIAYLLNPLICAYRKLLVRLKFFKSRTRASKIMAVNLTYLSFFLLIAAILSLLVSSVSSQLKLADFDDIINLYNGYSQTVNDFYTTVMDKLSLLDISSDQLASKLEAFMGGLLGIVQKIAIGALSSIGSLTGSVSTFFFSLIISIYFSMDGESIIKYLSKIYFALFSEKTNLHTKLLLADADKVFSGYIRGQLIDVFIMMILISLSLSIIGVKFAIVIGIVAGLANLVPYFGPIVAYLATGLVCLINGDYRQLVIAIIALVIIQFLDGNVIGPRLLSQQIDIHPLMVIIFLIIGGAVFGMMGMLLAVPVGSFLQLLFVRYVDYRIGLKTIAATKKGDL